MRLLLGILFFGLASCGSREVKNGLAQETAFPSNFKSIRDRIITPKCAVCHEQMLSHKELLKDYVVAGSPERSLLYTEVEGGGMPLYSDKLLDEEVESIRLWIQKGAPLD